MPDPMTDAQDTAPILYIPPPQAQPNRPYRRVTVWLVLALTALIMVLWWLGTPGGLLGKADAVGYAICHQITPRSFLVHGEPLPLCARCTGIYLGVMFSLGILLASGRGRASQFAPKRVLVLLAIFVMILGVDGVNSYLHLFPGYVGPYSPNNFLRLITGSLTGITMLNIIFPVFNWTVWSEPADTPTLKSLRELGGLLLVILLVDALVLVQHPWALTIFGLISAAGPVVVLTMVWTILFLSFTRRENTIRKRTDLVIPLLAGIAVTFLMIGVIDWGRYQLTGTWEGFDFSTITSLDKH